MVIFPGWIYTTESVDRALYCQHQYNAKVIYVGDDDQDVTRAFNGAIIYASVLTPPYDAFQAILNDDMVTFSNTYTSHLNMYECQMMLATIVASIYKGINIVLLFPGDTAELRYPQFLLSFIATNLGIQAGTDDIPFAYNNAFDDDVMNFLYMYNYVQPYEYIFRVNNVTPMALQKLISELQIVVKNPNDVNEYLEYVQRIHDVMVQSNTIPAIKMFSCDPTMV